MHVVTDHTAADQIKYNQSIKLAQHDDLALNNQAGGGQFARSCEGIAKRQLTAAVAGMTSCLEHCLAHSFSLFPSTASTMLSLYVQLISAIK